MQPPPTAADLLATVAQLLDEHVVPALTGPVQHQTRVAASLVAIVERELRLGPDIDAAERAAWVELLDRVAPDTAPSGNAPSGTGAAGEAGVESQGDTGDELAALRSRVATALASGAGEDDDVTWETLMRTVRDDLRIARPGHDSWDGD